ncbi:TPA: hypothetical protein N0F65_012075 [Lagenidium giganteum]|uniref:Uncharacterized protein n=1 Tax=Lagenidium giganteum TaxID=4803 RepID=A0AAV2YJN1_9STRA|nr:TPA: hypothetical protein N0F65_012075 [Lagenidium giganteum]
MQPGSATFQDALGVQAPLITLAARGQRIHISNIVGSTYNPKRRELFLVTDSDLSVYGHLLELGGQVRGLLAAAHAEANERFMAAIYLGWVDAFGVFVQVGRSIEHRVYRADLKSPLTSHVVCVDAALVTACAVDSRKEIATADTGGGIKIWVMRCFTATASSHAANASSSSGTTFKGILRFHMGATSKKRKTYRHLFAPSDGVRLLCATGTRLYVVDVASGGRIASLRLAPASLPVAQLEYNDEHDFFCARFHDDERRLVQFSIRTRKSKQHELYLHQDAEYEHGEDCLAFCPAALLPTPALNNDMSNGDTVARDTPRVASCFVLDACGNFAVGSLTSQQQLPNLEPSLSLGFNPLAEPFHRLHAELRPGGRNFVVIVSLLGIHLIEVFQPTSDGRVLVLTTSSGPRLSTYSQRYQRLLLFEPDCEDIRELQMREVSTPLSGAQSPGPATSPTPGLVDYAFVDEAVNVIWTNGTAEMYSLADERYAAAKIPDVRSSHVSAMTCMPLEDRGWFVAAGDTSGTIHLWLSTRKTPVRQATSIHAAHLQRLAQLYGQLKTGREACLLLSLAQDGEIKLWSLHCNPNEYGSTDHLEQLAGDDQRIGVELHAQFRTQTMDLTSSALLRPEFLFCGFASGTIECWRLPNVDSRVRARLHRQAARLAVVRTPLHAIDLHLTPVLEILVEPASSNNNSNTSTPNHAVTPSRQATRDTDAFSWVVSYDQTGIVFVWCFCLDFFFPHRRIHVHAAIKGSFLTSDTRSGSMSVFAYVGRCVEKLDQLTQQDRNAIVERVRAGRRLTAMKQDSNDVNIPSFKQKPRKASSSNQDDQPSESTTNEAVTVTERDPSDPNTQIKISVRVPAALEDQRPQRKARPGLQSREKGGAPAEKLLEWEGDGDESHKAGCAPMRTSRTLRAKIVVKADEVLDEITEPNDVRTPPATKKPSTTTNVLELATLQSVFQQQQPRLYRADRTSDASTRKGYSIVSITGEEDEASDATAATRSLKNDHDAQEAHDALMAPQDKVSIISLGAGTGAESLVLDVRGSSRSYKHMPARKRKKELEMPVEHEPAPPMLISWDALEPEDRQLELQAATKSRCVRAEALKDGVHVPLPHEVASTDLRVQLAVHAFIRWFAATQQHRQRVREMFLWEELRFAAQDAMVQREALARGVHVLAENEVGNDKSPAWNDFLRWYSTGKTSVDEHDLTFGEQRALTRRRITARPDFLAHRLQVVDELEEQVQQRREEDAAALIGTTHALPPLPEVYVFERFTLPPPLVTHALIAWENIPPAQQQQELALALLDTTVQLAAMSNAIELPDLACVNIEGLDLVALLAPSFLPWWKAASNQVRDEFLTREANAAAEDSAVSLILEAQAQAHAIAQAQSPHDKALQRNRSVFEQYFRADDARARYLEVRLTRARRQRRFASVAQFGKTTPPLLYETLPVPLMFSYDFHDSEDEILDFDGMEAMNDQGEVDEATDLVGVVGTGSGGGGNGLTRVKSVASNGHDDEELQRRLEEIDLMAREDALAREWAGQQQEPDSDDENEIRSPIQVHREDFSQAYFFDNLPPNLRFIGRYGWYDGSGVDNDDEIVEERQRRERELQRQRLLDQREAERVAEEERKAEAKRVEKEMEERALQFRRQRQMELKRVLAHQLELEVRRRREREAARLEGEQNAMAMEEIMERRRLEWIARENTCMGLEDQRATLWRKEIRDAVTRELRRLLSDQTMMMEEDKRSRAAAVAFERSERERLEHLTALRELYTPFEPYFPSARIPHETFLPAMPLRALEQRRHRKQRKQLTTPAYTVPFAEALVTDEIERDAYVARDSQRFQKLLGLPRSTGRRVKRIPTELDMIELQQQQRTSPTRKDASSPATRMATAPFSREFSDRSEDDEDDWRFTVGHTPLQPTQVAATAAAPRRRRTTKTRDDRRTILPLLEHAHSPDREWSDMQRSTTAAATQQSNASRSNKQAAVPFFRGNFGIQGQGQRRSQDYAY